MVKNFLVEYNKNKKAKFKEQVNRYLKLEQRKNNMEITLKWLVEKRACTVSRVWFLEQKTTSVDKLFKVALEEERYQDIRWAMVRLMSHDQLARFILYLVDLYREELSVYSPLKECYEIDHIKPAFVVGWVGECRMASWELVNIAQYEFSDVEKVLNHGYKILKGGK